MFGIIFCLFVIGVLLLVGSFHYFRKYQKPGVYPPKRILRQRIVVLGSGGGAFVLLGFLCMVFTK